jgi:hypothetical protein
MPACAADFPPAVADALGRTVHCIRAGHIRERAEAAIA